MLDQSSDIIGEETGDSWLRQVSENKARSHNPKKKNVTYLDERVSVTNAIQGDENERRKSSTSIYLRPTTMRGIPLASLTPSPVTRGFYVTKSENDLSSLAGNLTSPYTTIDAPVEQQTETTLIPDISTTDEIVTVAHDDQNESKLNTSNGNVSDIVTDEVVTIIHSDQNELKSNIRNNNINDIMKDTRIDIHEEKVSTYSSMISSEDSRSAENYEESDIITIPAGRPASKRGKSLSDFSYNTTPLSNAYVISPTTPTKRKIALAVSRYNEATTPLWTGRRVVVRKRNRNIVSPIKDAIRRTESNSLRTTATISENASLISTSSSTRRKSFATTMASTIPLVVSESTSTEIFNIRSDLANSTDTKTDHPESRANSEAIMTLRNSVNAATPSNSEIALTTDNYMATIISTISDDLTTEKSSAIANISIITTTPSTVVVAKAPAITNDAITATTRAINTGAETTSTTANYSITSIPTTTNTQAIANNSIIKSTLANIAIEITSTTANYSTDVTDATSATTNEIETTFANTDSFATAIPKITSTNAIADFAATATIGTGFETSTIANSVVTVPATIITDPTITTTTAATSTGIETISTITDYSAFTVPTTTNMRATIPVTTISPLTTVISSTNTHIRATTPMTADDLADVDTVTTKTIPATTFVNTIIPTITDPNVITTSSNANIPSTSAIINAMITQSRTSPPTSAEASVTSTNIMSSATTETITTESSTVNFANSSVVDISGNSELAAVTATAESIQTAEIPTTFEISPMFAPITTAISKSLASTSSGTSSVATTSFSSETNESFVTPMISRTPSILLSILTPIANTATALEKSTILSTLSATSSESIATNTIIQTTASPYESNSIQTVYEKSTTPELKTGFKKAISIQNQTEAERVTTIHDPSSVRTTSEESTTLKIKITSSETTEKAVQSRKENQTISEFDTTDYQFGQKRRRVINRTNNWNGRPVTQQRTNQYPRRRVTVYRGRPRRPPSYTSSSRVIEENRKRRIMQKRVRVNSINNTVRPDKSTVDIQNTTEDHVEGRAENVRRRMKVVLKRVKERVEEKETITLSPKETTVFLQSSTTAENETLQVYHENQTIENEKRKALQERTKPESQEIFITEETSANSDSTNKNLSGNSQNYSHTHENVPEQEKMRRKMRVVLKSVRPKSEEKNPIEEASTDSTNKNFQGNFSRNLYVDENIPNRGSTRRRMRVVLRSVKPKSKEKNSTLEEINADTDLTDKDLQDALSNNFSTTKNLPEKENERKTRRKMRVVLTRIRPKSEEGEIRIEEASADANSTDESLQGAFSSNFHSDKNLAVKYGTRKRMRVVLKSIRPKSEERNSTAEDTSADLDPTDKNLQGNFSSSLYTNENPADEEEARKRMEAVPKIKSKSEERDSIAEETNADFDFINKHPQIFFTFNFPSNFHDNLPDKKRTMMHSKSEEGEATTEQPEDTELQTTGTSVPVEEDTDRPSLEVKNRGSINRKTGSGYSTSGSNRQRKLTQSTTIAPLTNTLPSTHRRGRPIETTLSPRIDVGAYEGTESYIKATVDDQKADVSDQSIRTQEFAVTLADPPSSSSDTGLTSLRDAIWRKISTTVAPRTDPTTGRTVTRYDEDFRSRQRPKTKDRPTINATTRPRRPPPIDYDYYEDDVPIIIGKSALNSKLFLTSKGTIRCLDQGNFPHPYSCKKFITCARMVNGQVIGTEYTCPAKLSFDPVGGICNWSAGLGCKD